MCNCNTTGTITSSTGNLFITTTLPTVGLTFEQKMDFLRSAYLNDRFSEATKKVIEDKIGEIVKSIVV